MPNQETPQYIGLESDSEPLEPFELYDDSDTATTQSDDELMMKWADIFSACDIQRGLSIFDLEPAIGSSNHYGDSFRVCLSIYHYTYSRTDSFQCSSRTYLLCFVA